MCGRRYNLYSLVKTREINIIIRINIRFQQNQTIPNMLSFIFSRILFDLDITKCIKKICHQESINLHKFPCPNDKKFKKSAFSFPRKHSLKRELFIYWSGGGQQPRGEIFLHEERSCSPPAVLCEWRDPNFSATLRTKWHAFALLGHSNPQLGPSLCIFCKNSCSVATFCHRSLQRRLTLRGGMGTRPALASCWCARRSRRFGT